MIVTVPCLYTDAFPSSEAQGNADPYTFLRVSQLPEVLGLAAMDLAAASQPPRMVLVGVLRYQVPLKEIKQAWTLS